MLSRIELRILHTQQTCVRIFPPVENDFSPNTFDDGKPNAVGFYGFTNCFAGAEDGMQDTMNLADYQVHPLYVPCSTMLTSFWARFVQGGLIEENEIVHVRVYKNNTNSDIFTAIPETDLILTSRTPGTPTTIVEGIKTGLKIPVEAGDRLLMSFYVTSPGVTKAVELLGNGCGALVLA